MNTQLQYGEIRGRVEAGPWLWGPRGGRNTGSLGNLLHGGGAHLGHLLHLGQPEPLNCLSFDLSLTAGMDLNGPT